MDQYRYSLEKGSRKHLCPDCNKKKLVRYIDTNTGEYIPDNYGRCDSEVNCNYHLNPYADGYAKMIWQQERGDNSGNWKPARPQTKQQVIKPKREPAFIPVEVLNQTLAGYDQNVFLQNLVSRVTFPFNVKDVERVISQYRLGTVCNGYRAGAITFPFIDIAGNVRTIQVKQFDEANHTTGTDFLHSIIERNCKKGETELPEWLAAYQSSDLKVSCLFGEHLLSKYPLNPVALVEAPKTAIYGTLYFGLPDNPKNFLWLAVYNLSSLNYEKCKELKGRDVYLFPDLSKDGKAFDLWNKKANEITKLMPGTLFKLSDLLERNATDDQREKGQDLADYLIQLNWWKFRGVPDPPPTEEPEPVKINQESESFGDLIKKVEPIAAVNKFSTTEFKQWFNGLPELPSEIFVMPGLTVCNPAAFVTGRITHINTFEGRKDQGNRGLFIHQLTRFRLNVIDILNAG